MSTHIHIQTDGDYTERASCRGPRAWKILAHRACTRCVKPMPLGGGPLALQRQSNQNTYATFKLPERLKSSSWKPSLHNQLHAHSLATKGFSPVPCSTRWYKIVRPFSSWQAKQVCAWCFGDCPACRMDESKSVLHMKLPKAHHRKLPISTLRVFPPHWTEHEFQPMSINTRNRSSLDHNVLMCHDT